MLALYENRHVFKYMGTAEKFSVFFQDFLSAIAADHDGKKPIYTVFPSQLEPYGKVTQRKVMLRVNVVG